MLGHDNSAMMLIQPRQAFAERAVRNPDQFLFITRRALPYLKELGGTDDDIRALMVGNPRRYFEGAN